MLTQMLLCIHSSRPHHDPAVPLLREVRDRRRVLLGTGHGRIHWLGPPIVFGGGTLPRGKATEILFRTDSTGVAGRRTIGRGKGGLGPGKAARRDEPTLPHHPGLPKHRDQSPGHHSQPLAERQRLARTGAPAKKKRPASHQRPDAGRNATAKRDDACQKAPLRHAFITHERSGTTLSLLA